MEWFIVGFAATFTYVTFFMLLMPLELYFVYCNISALIYGEYTVILFSLSILTLYIWYVIKTKNAPFNGRGNPAKWLQESTLYKVAARYRPTRLHKTVELPSDKQYIFGVHPHSTIPTFVSIALMTEGCNFSLVFPGIKRLGLAASSNFIFPIWRETYLWLGYVDASKRTALNVLKRGLSLVILIGGEQEMIKAKPNENILCLKNRKGFARLALETGCSLVPVFAFRANDCYSSLAFLENVNKFLSKKFRVVLPVVYGAWFSPWPRKVPVDVVVGAPIEVKQNVNYTSEDVDKLHAQYILALEKLYDEHKHKYGSSNRELVIVDAE